MNSKQNAFEKINEPFRSDGNSVFGIARVIGRNDNTNNGRVRIYPIDQNTKDWRYVEHNRVESFPFAEPLMPGKGENHGFYYTPEFGDFVIYTQLYDKHIILGCINNPSTNKSAINVPVEAQNFQKNGLEYNTSHWPDLNSKGYHLDEPRIGDKYHPAAFLMRWRKNDFLIYNTTKVHENPNSAAKLMEFRTNENQLFQMVDLGNINIAPGTDGENIKEYSPVRQTDYRDLWEGFNINKEYWTERTDKPPLSHESQFTKLATNGHDYSEAPHGDTGADLPELTRGEFRLDDRVAEGSHETSKTYCPVYQTLKMAKGDDRYYQDKPHGPWEGSADHRFKIKKWIEDTGDPYDPEAQHFNVGHYLTLSNTIYKRRAMLSTKKGHQMVMSDIDKDEKVLLNSHRGKYVYMEDSDEGHYDAMWFASQKHHMIFCDNMVDPWLIDDKGAERHKLVDPNQQSLSSYQLIQTEKYQKIWLADSPDTPRIHLHTTDGHEILMLDHDKGVAGISPTPHKGKIQITTSDKMMQFTMDVENGDITLQNHNLGGKGKTGDIKLYAANNIQMDAKNQIIMYADMGFKVTSSEGMWDQEVVDTNVNCGTHGNDFEPVIDEQIRPTVLTDIETTEGTLTNKFDPS